MGKSYGPQGAPSALIPTTGIFDTTVINSIDIKSPEFRLFLVRLQDNLNQVAQAVNVRDAGYYGLTDFINGQLFFPNPTATSADSSAPAYRAVFRKVINFGALPNNATKTTAHGITITSGFTFTRIYATASISGTNFMPIPYASAVAADVVELFVDATNVSIKTGKDLTSYTACYVVLEYIKQ